MSGDWDGVPCGLLTARADGTIVEANRTLLEWTGRTREDVVGRLRVSDLLSVGGRIYWETHLSPLLHVEGRVDEIAVELKAGSQRIPVLMTAARDASPQGDPRDGSRDGPAPVHVVFVVARERARFERDLVAARGAAEQSAARVQALQQVTSALSRAAGVDAVATALLRSAREHLGAADAVLWLDQPGRGLTVHRPTQPVAAGAPEPPRAVLTQRRAVVEEGRVLVPMRGQSSLQAVAALTFGDGPGALPPDLEVLTAVGQQGGLALDRAWQHEQRAGIAHELQRSLLAGDPPRDPRYAVATSYRPGVETLEVGGDWHDAFLPGTSVPSALPLPSVLSVTVGDVVGRGLGAAIAMGQLRSALRAVTAPDVGPAAVLSALDRFVEGVEAGTSATVALAQLDLGSGHLRYACAGHLPPLLLPASGAPRLLWEGRSTPLGVISPTRRRVEGALQLAPGDALLLYTDGLIERRHRPLDLGLQALTAAAADVGDLPLPDAVQHLARTLLADEDSRDDVCLLLLRWLGEPVAPD